MGEHPPGNHAGVGFGAGLDPWLERLGNLRNVVRQQLVARQLDAHLPSTDRPLRVLDVGAGQGTQAIRLARLGHVVTAVEPSSRMRAAFARAAAALEDEARERVTLLDGDVAAVSHLTSPAAYDVVMCHGVLMYLPESGPAIAELARCAAPGALVSVVARNADALAWRPASRRDWAGVLATLDEQDQAIAERRDPWYVNEIHVRARADRLDELTARFERERLRVEQWYGIRVASDDVGVDTPAPPPAELARIVEVEDRLGRTDPYRRLGTLVHVVARAVPPRHRGGLRRHHEPDRVADGRRQG
ncbi:MAG TPA: methyltransferase domain-containing protein [Intrasporangium sp.]|uniref:methyltransferase domain-containing protein n=1 Tax=Intrasporangium sp. TaxID=1925024 RepID=UPI002B45EB4C|nr:methyltransferase domain-containing protein [Intrasporangium sp.]HKX66633.1 methyltransferase domain-containing protein [Intrasporangium sp.]